jgi:hypothetical protein
VRENLYQYTNATTGTHFVELMDNSADLMYVDIVAPVGVALVVSFQHKGRCAGMDVLLLKVGPTDGALVETASAETSSDGWKTYAGAYTTTTASTRLAFVPLSSSCCAAQGKAIGCSKGNFLDDVRVTCAPAPPPPPSPSPPPPPPPPPTPTPPTPPCVETCTTSPTQCCGSNGWCGGVCGNYQYPQPDYCCPSCMVNTCNIWAQSYNYWVVYTTTCQTICPSSRHLLAEADSADAGETEAQPLPLPTLEWIATQANWVRATATNSVNTTVHDGELPGRRLLGDDASSAEAGEITNATPLPLPTLEWIAEQDNWVRATAANSVNVTVHA